jgi:hypothetical protein
LVPVLASIVGACRGWHLPTIALALVGSGCAKPTPVGDESSEDVELRAPGQGPTSCPASKIREVRYASTVSQQTKLPAEIGARRCVEDLSVLDEDIACAQAFNQANWERAMFDRGLAPLDVEAGEGWFEDAQYGLEFGTVVEHPDDRSVRLVFVGFAGDSCGGPSVHTTVGPSTRLARRQDGDVVLVVAKPEVESREYARCSCDPGCGMMREATPLFVELPERATFAGIEELVYPAIAIVSHDVENTTCCCAP